MSNVALKVKIFESKGTQVLQIGKSALTIGSASHCDVVLSHPSVHPEHVRAWLEGGRVWVQDLGGDNGTSLNDIRLPGLKPMLVRDLDLLKLGSCEATLGVEPNLMRAPVVKAPSLVSVPDDPMKNASKDAAIVLRKAELETLGRELAELRLQLQMARLEANSNQELASQLRNLKDEIKANQDQRTKWSETVRSLEDERQQWRVHQEAELRELKVRLEREAHAMAARQPKTESIAAPKREPAVDATAQNNNLSNKFKAEIKSLQEKIVKANDAVARLELERKEHGVKVEAQLQQSKAQLARESVDHLSTQMRAHSKTLVKRWATRPLSQDMIFEWEGELVQIFRQVLLGIPAEPRQMEIKPESKKESKPEAKPEAKLAAVVAADIQAVDESENSSEKSSDNSSEKSLDESPHRRVWPAFAVALVLGAVLGVGAYFWKHNPNLLSSLLTTQVAAPAVEKPVAAKRVPAARYEPRQNKKYRNSYTDNVLFLEDYVGAEQNSDFRKRWYTELNKVAVDGWGMDEFSIGPVTLDEYALVQELARLRASIVVGHEQEGVQKMRAAEAKFIASLETIFKNQASVERFLKFKRAFYTRNQAYLSQ